MLIALASGQPWRFAYNCRSRFVRGTDYFSILERGINGVYYHVSHEHLPTYLAEFDFRYNARSGLGISDPQRAGKLLKGIIGKRLTYRRLTKPKTIKQKAKRFLR